ncbi:MAG TPA: chromate transporter, partial [Kofleriaceae bacterium]|nr:chromate transporter [Kofleriaceae bacterium]
APALAAAPAPAPAPLPTPHAAAPPFRFGRHHLLAAAALVAFLTLLVILPALASATRSRPVEELDAFYRSGSLVFGGGHVVLPLLRAELVPRGWLADDRFLAGYGAVQAVPGPLFTFSAYLGAAMHPGPLAWAHGAWCLVALFLPGWLLIGGALPWWHALRRRPWARHALAGAGAAVVGVLLAALYQPVMSEAIAAPRDVAAALVAFALLEQWRVPPWALVIAMAAAGAWL